MSLLTLRLQVETDEAAADTVAALDTLNVFSDHMPKHVSPYSV